jgi:hypothetical protein
MELAEQASVPARVLPGVSALECLTVDLLADPANEGMMIIEATHFLVRRIHLNTDFQTVLVQVGGIGVSDSQVQRSNKRHRLFERLIEQFGPDHPATLYVAALSPDAIPLVMTRRLNEWLDPALISAIPSMSTLYLPPRTIAEEHSDELQALAMAPYANPAAATAEGQKLPPLRPGRTRLSPEALQHLSDHFISPFTIPAPRPGVDWNGPTLTQLAT